MMACKVIELTGLRYYWFGDMDTGLKLRDALRILQMVGPSAEPYPVSLICASTPEPFSKLLAASAQQRLRNRQVVVGVGLFGNLSGNLASYCSSGGCPAVMLMEWADLDARLGVRQFGGWGRSSVVDILGTVQSQLNLMGGMLAKHAIQPFYLVPPLLSPPPVVQSPPWHRSSLELGLEDLLSGFLARAAENPIVRVLNTSALSEFQQPARMDLKNWLAAGAPYKLEFASAVAALVAEAMSPAAPAKGLITDLDDTVWAGILGEVGVENVNWDLEHHAAIHGLYQQFLQSLSEDGTLVAIASKNDRALVEQVWNRPDLLLKRESVFPMEVHWQPKVESAARILQLWNINPDAVVFVDDSPLEVASMKAAFPSMDCRLFPAENPDDFWAFLSNLNARFGKLERREEDVIRLRSIRAGAERALFVTDRQTQEDVLRELEGRLTITRLGIPPDPRALELVNKTNQFNLNGVRYTDADWVQFLQQQGAAAWIASYTDKFGPLGKIAVVGGTMVGKRMELSVFVLSCRAFSRQIEHAILDHLFATEKPEEIVLNFFATERDGPTREFLEHLTGDAPQGPVTIRRKAFEEQKPGLYLTVGSN